MKVIQVELPDKVAIEIEALVRDGLFLDEKQVVYLALTEFVRHNRLALLERFQREDIAWALQCKEAKA